MTTVEFGGGPTIEARRRFANLKDGSEIPRWQYFIYLYFWETWKNEIEKYFDSLAILGFL